jgi:hypothetical protein
MKRFEYSTYIQLLAPVTALLICIPLLFASGCDMGTYNKRLNEKTIDPPVVAPTAEAEADDAGKSDDPTETPDGGGRQAQ